LYYRFQGKIILCFKYNQKDYNQKDVILSEAKDLLQIGTCVSSQEILRFAQDDGNLSQYLVNNKINVV